MLLFRGINRKLYTTKSYIYLFNKFLLLKDLFNKYLWSICSLPGHEELATHSSILAWRITWTEKPGGLESMGSQRVGHD